MKQIKDLQRNQQFRIEGSGILTLKKIKQSKAEVLDEDKNPIILPLSLEVLEEYWLDDILSFGDYDININPTETPFYKYWEFKHQNFDYKNALVVQDNKNELSGKKEHIEFLQTCNILKDKFEISKQVLKEYYDDINRCQTGHILRRKKEGKKEA